MTKGTLDEIVKHILDTREDSSNRFLIMRYRFKVGKLSEISKKKLAKHHGYKTFQDAIYIKK